MQELIFKLNTYIFNPLIVAGFAIATAYFIWGIIGMMRNAANKELTSRKEARDHMFWGLVGLLIMVSVFGILNLLVSVFGIKGIDVDKQTVDSSKFPKIKIDLK